MKLGIMQPYFFPYINHFSLIASTDKWVVFDIAQYTPRTWMNRNRILHPVRGWQYVTVPLKNSSQSIRIREALVMDRSAAAKRIQGQIGHYRKHAPFFRAVSSLVDECFESTQTDFLCDLNINSLKVTCRYLSIPFDYSLSSDEHFTVTSHLDPGEWALMISSHFGAKEYINPLGGNAIFDDAKFSARGIKLSFLNTRKFEYPCKQYEFIEYLSILDVLMWNDPQTVRDVIYSPILLSKREINQAKLPPASQGLCGLGPFASNPTE